MTEHSITLVRETEMKDVDDSNSVLFDPKKYPNLNDNRMLCISGDFCGYPSVVSCTAYGYIKGFLNNNFSPNDLDRMEKKVNDLETDNIGSPQWNEFTLAISEYAVYRYKILGKDIRLVHTSIGMRNIPVCVYCCEDSSPLMACRNCRVKYCSIDCQRADWPFHKKECVPHRPLKKLIFN